MNLEWQYGKPPNDVMVEVEDVDGNIKRCKAIYGDYTKGIRPHWEHESGLLLWEANAFKKWRHIV